MQSTCPKIAMFYYNVDQNRQTNQVRTVSALCLHAVSCTLSFLGPDWNPAPAAAAFRLTDLSGAVPHGVSDLEGAASVRFHYAA